MTEKNNMTGNDFIPKPPDLPKTYEYTLEQPPKSQGSGVWKFLGIGCAVLIILLTIGGFLAFRAVKGIVSGVAEKYTSSAPAELPAVEVSEDEWNHLSERVDAFVESLVNNNESPTLSLTSRDLNVLIKSDENWKEVAGNLYVTLEGDRIRGQTSFPLDAFGSIFKGRYLNGNGVLQVGMTAGRLMVFMDQIEIDGKSPPKEFMEALGAENLAEEANKKPEVRAILDKLESITVRDGKLVIVAKGSH